ncbi:MAG: dialkylresorcinol condensing enzyme [Deltaproteobacteria bacterium]|nr:dialkylresorcinol condensing enzyme [Deltaproteobacteria bacterium]
MLHYSQTGQLTDAARSMVSPLEGRPDIEVVWENIQPKKPYPFPWPFFAFFSVFPEAVHMVAPEMKPVSFDPDGHFDLVILAYQVWFLSPSLPMTGFLKSEAARVLKGKPVITLIVCRNMWLNAQEKMKRLLTEAGARLIDNVALVDPGPPLTTFVTTPRWLMTGKKDGFWGFPPAGVSKKDIAGAARFGRAIADALTRDAGPINGPLLTGLGAVKVNPSYIGSEKIAHRSFYVWGKLLLALGSREAGLRKALTMVYVIFLLAMIVTVVPLGVVVRMIFGRVFKKRLAEQVARLEEPSGSSLERMARG